jgi:hypothetical protein
VIAPYDHEAFWVKAQVFLNRAMDPNSHRSFEALRIWADLVVMRLLTVPVVW